jgi:hypothetical protein
VNFGLTAYCEVQRPQPYRGGHELGVVLLVYLLHGSASARAPIRIFSMLSACLSKLLEGVLQSPRYVGRKHLAGLSSHTLGGVYRPRGMKTNVPGGTLTWRSPTRKSNSPSST